MHRFSMHPSAGSPIDVNWEVAIARTQLLLTIWHPCGCRCTSLSSWEQWLCPCGCSIPVVVGGIACTEIAGTIVPFSSQNGHKCLQTTGIFYLQNKSFYPLDVDIPYCEFYILWQMYLLICFRHWRTYSPVPRRLTNLCKQVSKLNMKAKSHGCSIVYKV